MRIISAERLSATQRHLGLIVAAWLAYLAVLGSLQLLGYKSGFAVWPLGEDRNWISILLKGEGANAAGVFWQVNDRNPLSPWWYIAFRKLILGVEPGLLILRLLVGLSLGIASYVLIAAVTQTRILALGVGLAVTLWMANGYVDQIYWNFQAALVRPAVALDIIVISLCLVAPTVAVEALGATWIPGEIWRKYYQFSTSALALCALFALLAWRGKGIARPAWAAVTGAFCAIAVLSLLSVIGLIIFQATSH
jgi:hypothetical protein